jgi:hypothetical protein
VVAVIVLVAALGASWWLINVDPGPSSGATSSLSRAPVGGFGSPAAPSPSASAVAAEGARIEGLVSDLNGLQTQLDPAAASAS